MQLEVGTIVEGKVSGITNFGAFVDLPNGKTGMVHISEVSTDFVKDIKDYLKIGQVIKAKIINISEKNEIALSVKKLMPQKPVKRLNQSQDNNQNTGKTSKFSRPGNFEWQSPKKNPVSSFEEMLSSFKHKSEEKISDLKRATESKRGSFSRRGSQR